MSQLVIDIQHTFPCMRFHKVAQPTKIIPRLVIDLSCCQSSVSVGHVSQVSSATKPSAAVSHPLPEDYYPRRRSWSVDRITLSEACSFVCLSVNFLSIIPSPYLQKCRKVDVLLWSEVNDTKSADAFCTPKRGMDQHMD